jgi:hypothetical protein
MKRFALVSAVLVVLGLTGFVGSAEASHPSPTPNGYIGACNMVASDTMFGFYSSPPSGPMTHDGSPWLAVPPYTELQGNVGMTNAVFVSGCS